MSLLVTLPVKTIEEACDKLKIFGVLIDYDKKKDLKINDKILLCKVHKIFPIYRRNEDCLSDGDCLSLLVQKAFPFDSLLSESPRVFRLLCVGDVIMKLAHIQTNTFIAIKNPKMFKTCTLSEPSFIVEKSVKIVWEFPNLKFPDGSQMITSVENDCQKLPPIADNENVEDTEDSPRLNGSTSPTLDVDECISHRSESPSDSNEKDVTEVEEVNNYVKSRTCHETLQLSPIAPQKERYNRNIRQRHRNFNAVEGTSSESSDCTKISKPEKENIKSTTKVNTRSFNINNHFHQLCDNGRSKHGHQHIDNICAQHQCCNPCQEPLPPIGGDRIVCCLIDSTYFRGCNVCQPTCTNNYRAIHNSAAVNGVCQIHSSKSLHDQAIVPVRSVHYRTSPNNCHHNLYLNGPKENNQCPNTNHCSCEMRNSTPLHKRHRSISISPERDYDIHKLGRRNDASPEPGPSKRCIKNKSNRNQSVSPMKSRKELHRSNKFDLRNVASHEPGPSKQKLCMNNSRTPERYHPYRKKRMLYNSNPDLSEYERERINSVSPVRDKDKFNRNNNSKSPERGHLKNKSDSYKSKSSERSQPKNKSDRNKSKSFEPKNKSDSNNSKSPEGNHPNSQSDSNKFKSPDRDNTNNKKKKLYFTDQNLSNLLIGNFSPIDSVPTQTVKKRCNLGNQREDSSKTEKFHLALFNKSEVNPVPNNKKLLMQEAVEEGCSKSSDSVKDVHPNTVEIRKDLISEVEQLSENNVASVQEESNISPLHNTIDGEETINPTVIEEANLLKNSIETDGNSMVLNCDVPEKLIEKPNENLIKEKEINSLEKRNSKSDSNDDPGTSGSGLNSATQDLQETSTAMNAELQPSEIMSQPYYDAEEGNTDLVKSQVNECIDIIKTLSDQSFNSFKQLFSAESDDFREDVLLTLRNLKKRARITAVVVDICPDIRLDPLSIVKGTCLSGCRQSFYINTIAYQVMKNPKCKCCRLVTHFVCPSCSQQYGKSSPMCLSFCFGLDVLYGQNVLTIAVNGSSAERFLGCTLSNYLAYSSVSSYIVSIMKKIIISRPPEDWSNAILLKLNVKSIGLSTGQIVLKLINTYVGDSLIRKGCFISLDQL
ncbi:hypothetical protein O3M35_008164 [Rhynocoris fuscipes]|uniref:Uncharacterized protein n=1 Tax=Rhynocoris fuscipes TaxID=488301 RepID=A0AAW1D7Z9_9HEMI